MLTKKKTHDSTATLETRLKMFTRILPRQSEQTEAVLACTAFGSCSTINIFILSTKRFLTATRTSCTSAQPSLMRLLYKGFSKILLLLQDFHSNYDAWKKPLLKRAMADVKRMNHLWLKPSRLLLPRRLRQILSSRCKHLHWCWGVPDLTLFRVHVWRVVWSGLNAWWKICRHVCHVRYPVITQQLLLY